MSNSQRGSCAVAREVRGLARKAPELCGRGVLAVLVVSGHRAAVAVILAATAAGLATAIFHRRRP